MKNPLKAIRKFLRIQDRDPRSTQKAFFKIGGEGFTLPEAIMAMGILAVGIVGLQAALRRGTINSVRAWDKENKTAIAMARMEEHKAQIFQNFKPNMPLPVIMPVVRTGATPGIDFIGNTLTYSSDIKVVIDAATNGITIKSGYGLTFPTPGISPTYYYGNVNPNGTPTPNIVWGDVKNRTDPCDQTGGSIDFNLTTPAGISGQLYLEFVDYLSLGRNQVVWMNGLQRQSYAAGDISATPTAPTSLSFAISSFDTASGLLAVRVQQSGIPNLWGSVIEDGTNQLAMTVQCDSTAPTPTPTPTVNACNNGDCNQVGAAAMALTGDFYLGGFSTSRFQVTSGGTGTAKYVFPVPCAGIYKVQANVNATCNNCGTRRLKVTMQGAGITATNLYTGSSGITCVWGPNINNGSDGNSFQVQDIDNVGGGTNNNPDDDIAQWQMSGAGSVTITFYPDTNTGDYPRVRWICLTRISGAPTPTPTTGNTPTRTPTPSSICSFQSIPTPLDIPSFANYQGTPGFAQFGCDPNTTGLTAFGLANTTRVVRWWSKNISELLEYPGKVKANVRLMNGMAVTMRLDTNGAPVTAGPVTATTNGWYELTTAGMAANSVVQQVFFDFTQASTVTTNYIAVDSVRIVYDNPVNPNAVLDTVTLSVLDTFRDVWCYRPLIVDSSVRPMETPGMATGYKVEVVVHSGRYIGMVTPTPGFNVNQATPVPYGVVTDSFAPVTVINSISQ